MGIEAEIQKAIIRELMKRGWSVRPTHGNLYQHGFPDLFCCHKIYGIRWVEVKDPARRGNVFTPSQAEYFHELASHGVGVWILIGHTDDELRKLHEEPNWVLYLPIMRKGR